MPNRQLTTNEIETIFRPLLNDVRRRLDELSGGDPSLLFALRRKLFKDLSYLERGKPMSRNKLKAFKRGQQGNLCATCAKPLPEKGAELDRLNAQDGYTAENTRLVHHDCHVAQQQARNFS